MGAMTGIVAGVATLGGAIALYRLTRRRAAAWRASVEQAARDGADVAGAVIDYERDPETGVYRQKS